MAGIDIKTILYAAAGGMAPTFLWLWFWLTKESDHDARPVLLALAYIGGTLGVLILLPLRNIFMRLTLAPHEITIIYAALEEIIKVGIVALITFNHSSINDGSDYTTYLVTGALGFSALENTLYLINPINEGTDLGTIIITGNMRFLGATVLHTISVAIVGVMIGLAFSAGKFVKFIHFVIGMGLAVGLHAGFNYFIMQGTRQGTLIAIAGIWFVAVIVILLFDRLKAMQENIVHLEKQSV